MAEFVAALDAGTTSTRFIVFDHAGRQLGSDQLEHQQILPRPGWVEHSPVEIVERARSTISSAMLRLGLRASDLAAVGITNQRETTVVWNRHSGRPYANAIVWADTRTDDRVRALAATPTAQLVRERSGLPPSTYFSAGKLAWLLDHVDGLRADAERGDAIFGTVDSWLVWNLTGGARHGGVHVTDVTNAGRTMLMNLRGLRWDPRLLEVFGVPEAMLAPIHASSDPRAYGVARAPEAIAGVPLTGVLGDQHAAMLGQACLAPGEAKTTYGTGNFLLQHTGTEPVASSHGLVSTVCFQRCGEPATYALEGSVAVTGAAVQWLRDQLGLIARAADIEALAAEVDDTAGAYFVPAFSGLFAPHWRADARGAVVGLTRSHTRAHLARATLEAICYQTRDVVEAMSADTGLALNQLKADGGVTDNALCMQLQADILGIPVRVPAVRETTALGAAYAAGLAVGYWSGPGELRENWTERRRFEPGWSAQRRREGYAGWRRAVTRTLDWDGEP